MAGGSPPRSGGGRMATVLEPEAVAAPREQARARYPDTTGFIERDGVRVFYEVYGSGEPAILLLPTWSIIHSRFWKMQIPDLARRYRVIAFDGRGNGRSDRPTDPAARQRGPGGQGSRQLRRRPRPRAPRTARE